MHREFGIINSYTLEISFCGATQGVYKDTHFSQKVLKVSVGVMMGPLLIALAECRRWGRTSVRR